MFYFPNIVNVDVDNIPSGVARDAKGGAVRSIMANKDRIWEIDRIMAIRISRRGKEEYFVKWSPTLKRVNWYEYKAKDMTWVRSSQLECRGERGTDTYTLRDHYENTLNAMRYTHLPRQYAY